MKNTLLPALCLIMLAFTACNTASHGLFSRKTQHEKYASSIEDQPESKAWLAASDSALAHPVSITLPYRHAGYFPKDKPRALALKFSARRGEKITVHIARDAREDFVLYADLFPGAALPSKPLVSGDTNNPEMFLDVNETGDYVLRVQPELLRTGAYDVSITAGPSLGFPVSGNKASIGSVWGDSRDGGKRGHEGIDIFAPKRTPVVAAADGFVTGVREGGIGGKTVWMNVENRNISLYYAHLDVQLVSEGQRVFQGDTLGLVGNTGNAATTASHLHFGIYTRAGAEDPISFVRINKSVATQPATRDLHHFLRLKKPLRDIANRSVDVKTQLMPLAVTARAYLVELPDGGRIIVPIDAVTVTRIDIDAAAPMAAEATGHGILR